MKTCKGVPTTIRCVRQVQQTDERIFEEGVVDWVVLVQDTDTMTGR